MASDRDLLSRLLDAVDRGEGAVLVTVVETANSVPRHAGAKMIVHADGREHGTIGGGEMEARVIDEALAALATGAPREVSYDLVDPTRGDPGVCGGTVTLYLEPFMPEPQLVVIGCGHVGKAVIELAHWLGLRVTAIDDRPELADPKLLPDADLVLSGPIGDALDAAEINDRTDVLLVTRNVGLDLEILPAVLQTPARSVGVMGSRRRWATTRGKLIEAGVDERRLDDVRSPLGLDLGAETPEEIAVSVLSELIALRRRVAAD